MSGTLTSPLLAALLARSTGAPNLPAHSRYLGLPTRTMTLTKTGADGSQLVYLSRRLIPGRDQFAVITNHTMRPFERLDQVAAAQFGDPCLAWRLCDANGALNPSELEQTGRVVAVTLPAGIPGRPVLKGLHLTMLAGPVVPVPLPQVVTDAITTVRVETDDDGSTFQVSFSLGKRSILETVFLLAGGSPIPLRVLLVATYNGIPEVLLDGLVRNTQVTPGSGGAATLTISGADMSAAMDLQEFTGLPYPAMPIEARVALIVAKYAFLGMVPLVIPSAFPDLPLPVERIPVHHGTDLAYVRELAKSVGYCFHILTPAPLVNLAYWGPTLRIGLPQPALNIDMDAYTNLESIHFDFANSARELLVLEVPIPETTQWLPLPLPDVSLLNPPLGLIEPLPSSIRMLSDVGGLSPIQIALRGLGQAAESTDSTTADGSLDIVQYGGLLKARSLVGVRGAGMGFDGLYYVKQVTHSISRGSYKQTFKLVRNGLVSITPRVPV